MTTSNTCEVPSAYPGDSLYEDWGLEKQTDTSLSSDLNTPSPEESIPNSLFSLNTGSFDETLEVNDTSEMGNILSKVLEETFSMRGLPPSNFDGNPAEVALRVVGGPSVWDEQLQHNDDFYYCDRGSDTPEPSFYETVCEPLTPPGQDCVTEYDIASLRKTIEEMEKKIKQLYEENTELRKRLNSLANILRREAWKRRKLSCEALTARFCLNISDKMVKQKDEIILMATSNYANLAYLTHKFSVECSIQQKTDALTDILTKSNVTP
jgi:regulator of replication initiation timing